MRVVLIMLICIVFISCDVKTVDTEVLNQKVSFTVVGKEYVEETWNSYAKHLVYLQKGDDVFRLRDYGLYYKVEKGDTVVLTKGYVISELY